jgi:hypothetical protein
LNHLAAPIDMKDYNMVHGSISAVAEMLAFLG